MLSTKPSSLVTRRWVVVANFDVRLRLKVTLAAIACFDSALASIASPYRFGAAASRNDASVGFVGGELLPICVG